MNGKLCGESLLHYQAQPLIGKLFKKSLPSLPAPTPGRVPHVRLLGVRGLSMMRRKPLQMVLLNP
jgi:hypothetical protein